MDDWIRTRSFSPEDGRAADVLGLQGHSLQELIAQAIVEGAVEAWSTSVRLQDTEALHFILTVHKQFCLVPIDPNQDHVLHGPADVTANQLVRDAVSERLQKEEEEEKRGHRFQLAHMVWG